MKRILSLIMMTLITSIAFTQNDSVLLDDYLSIKNALVKNDGKTASEKAKGLLIQFETSEYFKTKKNLIKKIKILTSTADIEKQRAVFSELSISLWEYIKSSKEINTVLYYQYCPMKDTYWISSDSLIKNPYYGPKMLTCGSTKETKK